MVKRGMADKVIAIELGYGRSVAGTIGTGVGFNANVLLSKAEQSSPWILGKANLTKANGKHHLVTTQLHHAFDVDREQNFQFPPAIFTQVLQVTICIGINQYDIRTDLRKFIF